MKKTYKIDVDCANCANKMEEAAKNTAGVKDATVNFMMLKMIVEFEDGQDPKAREFDSWISEKSTCRSHKTCFFCVKFLVFIYCILLQCVVKYNKGGILHASYYIEI